MRTFKLIMAITLALIGLIALLSTPRSITQAAPNATCTWTGPLDGTPRNWSTAANWSCGTVPGPGDTAIVNGGGIVINVDVPVSVQNLTLSFGELRGYQTLTVTGQITWTNNSLILGGAALSPTGALETLVIASGASLNLSNGRLQQSMLVNYGTVQHGNAGTLEALNAVFDNRASGVFAAANASIVDFAFPPGPAGIFTNTGTLIKQGSGEYRMTARLTNVGLINVVSDTLRLEDRVFANPTVTHTGAFVIAPAGTLILDNLKSDFATTSTINVSGTLRFVNGAAGTVRGTYDGQGLTDLSLAELAFEKPNGAATLTRLNLSGNARLRGTNDITVTSAMTMAGPAIIEGTSFNTNTLNIAPGATLLINQTSQLNARTLNNYGSMVLAAGQCFAVSGGAVFNNRPTGTFTVTAGEMRRCDPGQVGSAQFNNQGRFVKEGVGQFNILGVDVSNSGTFELNGGTLALGAAFVQTAGETRLRNGSILGRFTGSSGDFIFNGGAVRGTGTINFAVQNNGAVVDPIGLLAINNGGYQQGVSGTLHIDIDNFGHDQLQVNGSAALSGTLAISLTENYLALPGDVFDVMHYFSKTGRFSVIQNELAPAFNVVVRSDVVRLSTQPPNLLEIRKRAKFRLVAPGAADEYTIALFNTSNTIPLTVTLITDTLAPYSGFQYILNSTRGITTINPTQQVISVPLENGSGLVPVQALMWDGPFVVQPGEEVSLTFGIKIPDNSTTGVTTNYAAANYRDDTEQLLFAEVKNAAEIDIYRESGGGGPAPEVDPSPPPSQTQQPQQPGDPPGYGYPVSAPAPSDFEVSAYLPPEAPDSATMDAVAENSQQSKVFPMQRDPNDPRHFTANLPAAGVPQGTTVYAVARWPGNAIAQALFYWYRYDPSGIITDAQTGLPIKDATVTLYRVPQAMPDPGLTPVGDCRTIQTRPGGPAGDWDSLPLATPNLGIIEDGAFTPARIDPPLNPQVTGSDGRYGWDVIMGCWYIKVEAPGYFTRYSAVVGVPPEVTDLDIALEPWEKVYLPIVRR